MLYEISKWIFNLGFHKTDAHSIIHNWMHQNFIYSEKGISDSGELAGVGENQARK